MKKKSQIFRNALILFVSIIMLVSCRKVGSDGKIYLSIDEPTDLGYYLTSYTDNNPGIPSGVSYGTPYICSAGTYSFNYYASSSGYADKHVTGTYTLEANSGAKGGPFRKGADGEDRYYDLQCEYNGATASYFAILPNHDPVKFDTTYYRHGFAMRVTGTVYFGEVPTKEEIAKSKLHK